MKAEDDDSRSVEQITKKMTLSERFDRCLQLIRTGKRPEAEAELSKLMDLTLSGAALELRERLADMLHPAGQPDACVLRPGSILPDWIGEFDGTSLVTCAMNRTENLLKALPTWTACEGLDEIIIVDWSSRVPVADSIAAASLTDPRIRIVRVESEPRWILSYAFNLGFRFARGRRIVKTDADIKLQPDFFARNPLPQGVFVAGDWRKAAKGQEHINGFFYIHRTDLRRIRGFNEYITSYGWDDDDIYARMVEAGLERKCVDLQSIWHIPHDDALRLGQAGQATHDAWSELQASTAYKIRSNRWLTFVGPPWNQDRRFVPFKVIETRTGYVLLERTKDQTPNLLHEGIRADADYYTALEMLSWRLGTNVYEYSRNAVTSVMKRKQIDAITLSDLCIEETLGAPLSGDSGVRVMLVIACHRIHWPMLHQVVGEIPALAGMSVDVIAMASHEDASTGLIEALGAKVRILGDWRALSGLLQTDIDRTHDWVSEIRAGRSVAVRIEDAFMSRLKEESALQAPMVQIPRDRLFVDVQHGLGNRLRAWASAAAVASSCGRELVTIWQPDMHCECTMEDLVRTAGTVVTDRAILHKDVLLYNYMEPEPGSKKGEFLELPSGRDICVRSAYVLNHPASDWNTENMQLRSLSISEEVEAILSKLEVAGCVGVHVRMEAGTSRDDKPYDSRELWGNENHRQIQQWRDRSHYSVFFRKIDRIMAEQPDSRFFLATDLAENYAAFTSIYGDRVRMLHRNHFDRSRTQILYAMADAVLLSRCSRLLGSNWSSFSELASRLSITYQKVELAGIDF